MVSDNDLSVPEAALHRQPAAMPMKACEVFRRATFKVMESADGQHGNIWFITVTLNRKERNQPCTEVTVEGFPDVYQKFRKPVDWDPTTEELRQFVVDGLAEAIEKARANPD